MTMGSRMLERGQGGGGGERGEAGRDELDLGFDELIDLGRGGAVWMDFFDHEGVHGEDDGGIDDVKAGLGTRFGVGCGELAADEIVEVIEL